jgi:hypothetical protein
MRVFVIFLFLAMAVPLQAQQNLTPHTAAYKVKIAVLGGELTTQLVPTATGFEATHVIRPTGMSRMLVRGTIEETSRFDAVADGVRPREYLSNDTLSRDKTTAAIVFDWERGEARGTVNGDAVVSTIEGLAHDRVSIQYEVMQDLLNGTASDRYTMFEIDRLRPVNISIVGEKVVKVPAGTLEVIGVRHQSEGSKRATTLWCAAELGYLPVIIEQHRKEKLRVRATLMDYSPVPRGVFSGERDDQLQEQE